MSEGLPRNCRRRQEIEDRNAEPLSTQSSHSRTVSALSAAPRLKSASPEHGYVLTLGRTARVEEVEDDGDSLIETSSVTIGFMATRNRPRYYDRG